MLGPVVGAMVVRDGNEFEEHEMNRKTLRLLVSMVPWINELYPYSTSAQKVSTVLKRMLEIRFSWSDVTSKARVWKHIHGSILAKMICQHLVGAEALEDPAINKLLVSGPDKALLKKAQEMKLSFDFFLHFAPNMDIHSRSGPPNNQIMRKNISMIYDPAENETPGAWVEGDSFVAYSLPPPPPQPVVVPSVHIPESPPLALNQAHSAEADQKENSNYMMTTYTNSESFDLLVCISAPYIEIAKCEIGKQQHIFKLEVMTSALVKPPPLSDKIELLKPMESRHMDLMNVQRETVLISTHGLNVLEEKDVYIVPQTQQLLLVFFHPNSTITENNVWLKAKEPSIDKDNDTKTIDEMWKIHKKRRQPEHDKFSANAFKLSRADFDDESKTLIAAWDKPYKVHLELRLSKKELNRQFKLWHDDEKIMFYNRLDQYFDKTAKIKLNTAEKSTDEWRKLKERMVCGTNKLNDMQGVIALVQFDEVDDKNKVLNHVFDLCFFATKVSKEGFCQVWNFGDDKFYEINIKTWISLGNILIA